MSRKRGPDIRNGNWLFYDDKLLSTPTGTMPATESGLHIVSPGELADIITESNDMIFTALHALAERTRAANPDTAKSVGLGWLFTAKMVPTGSKMARGTVLRETAFDRQFSEIEFNDPKDFLPSSSGYIERLIQLGYSAQLLLAFAGWNEVRDGGWLQIQPK